MAGASLLQMKKDLSQGHRDTKKEYIYTYNIYINIYVDEYITEGLTVFDLGTNLNADTVESFNDA